MFSKRCAKLRKVGNKRKTKQQDCLLFHFFRILEVFDKKSFNSITFRFIRKISRFHIANKMLRCINYQKYRKKQKAILLQVQSIFVAIYDFFLLQ